MLSLDISPIAPVIDWASETGEQQSNMPSEILRGREPTKGYYTEGDQGPNYSKQCNSHEVAEELFLLHLEPDQG